MLSYTPLASQDHCCLQVNQAKYLIAAFYDIWPPDISVGKFCSMQVSQGKQYTSDGCLELCRRLYPEGKIARAKLFTKRRQMTVYFL